MVLSPLPVRASVLVPLFDAATAPLSVPPVVTVLPSVSSTVAMLPQPFIAAVSINTEDNTNSLFFI